MSNIMEENNLQPGFKKVDEKIVLITIIGILEAIKAKAITIEEAEKFLFSPHMAGKLNNNRCNEKVIRLILEGCELENIDSLISEKFNHIVDEIKQRALILLKQYEVFDEDFWLEDKIEK